MYVNIYSGIIFNTLFVDGFTLLYARCSNVLKVIEELFYK